MAIKVIDRGNNTNTNLSLFYDFLVQNKSSTFLNTMTFTYTAGNGNPLTITSANGSSTFKIQLAASSKGVDNEVTRYTTNGYYFANITYTSSTTCYSGCYLQSAILCDNGIIFNLRGYNSASSASANYIRNTIGIALTVDNHGELSILRTHQNLPDGTSYNMINNYWSAVSSTSTSAQTLRIETKFGSNRTCLAPIATAADDPDEYLPYAYVATSTQLAGEGLTAVRINGVDYITNGVWYIRDTPIT